MRKTSPLKIIDIEKIALNLRSQYKIPLDVAFPILDLIDDYQDKGILTMQILEDDDPILEKDTPAKYNPLENYIYIKDSILEELENNIYRANFTLAHELFHFFQNKVLNFEFHEVENCKSYEDPEWQANEFAGQLLVPNSELLLNPDAKFIANKLKVSEECILTRKLYYQRRENRKK